jgi:hypothetical protein
MLNYVEVPYDMQGSATQPMSVNPFDVQSYVGMVRLYPKTDHWFATDKVSYTQNEDGTYDGLGIPPDLVGPGFSALAGISDFYRDITGTRDVGVIDGAYSEYVPWGINSYHAYASSASGTMGQGGNDTLNTGNRADGNYETSRSIFLKQISSGEMISGEVLAAIEAALDEARLSHGSFVTSIIPYIREQDIVLEASGMKPLHKGDVRFDETNVERYFMPASKVYFRDQSGSFSPELGTGYEKITLGGTAPGPADALLLAVRDDHFSEEGIRVGYIVPLINKHTGLIDFAGLIDGYYKGSDGWNATNIPTHGFHAKSGGVTITNADTSASATLVTEISSTLGGGSTSALGHYNGHFSGVARSGDTAQIELSAAAGRYVANNFGTPVGSTLDSYTNIPRTTKIYIVDGPGQGQEAMVEAYNEGTQTATFVQPLRTPVGAGSVYAICMAPTNILRNPEVSQYGISYTPTNKHGEKYGILHIPRNSDMEFTYGKKLVEVSDRADGSNWLVSSYAATHFEAQGHKTTVLDNSDYISSLEQLVAPGAAFSTTSPPLLADEPYVPTYTAEGVHTGKLAIAHEVYIANGGVTTGDYEDGPAAFGSVGFTGDLTGGSQ